MEIQQFKDKEIYPNDLNLAVVMGNDVFETYRLFMDHVVGEGIEPQWRYYNDGKAWLCKGVYK